MPSLYIFFVIINISVNVYQCLLYCGFFPEQHALIYGLICKTCAFLCSSFIHSFNKQGIPVTFCIVFYLFFLYVILAFCHTLSENSDLLRNP